MTACNDRNCVRIGCLVMLISAIVLATWAPSAAAEQSNPDLKGITNPEVIKNRLLWLKETAGENLALGKPVRFSLAPNGPATTGESDATDLTSGTLSSRGDDMLNNAQDAVGWYGFSGGGVTEGVNMLIDLGSVQPIGKVVARFLCGGNQEFYFAPTRIDVVVSEDGRDFFQVASLKKLYLPDRNQADWKTTYWLPEDGHIYTYPFALSLTTKGRYIGLRVTGATASLFTDEIAVIKGTFPANDIRYDRETRTEFFVDGVIFRPIKKYLAISTNIRTPNFFSVSDRREKSDLSKPVTFIVETPPQVSFLPTHSTEDVRREEIAGKEGRMIRWSIPAPPNFGVELPRTPFYLKIDGALPNQANARFYAQCDGYEPNVTELPIRPIQIPQVPIFKDLHICLAWLEDNAASKWPDFFDAYAHMGFNVVPIRAGVANQFVAEARKRGFRLLCNDSPFHAMALHAGDAGFSEAFSQLESGPSKNLCPAYRGRFYQKEIERIGDGYQTTGGTDYYVHDMEIWVEGSNEAPQCRQCCQWQAQSGGKSMDECLVQMGTQRMADMYHEIQQRSHKMNRPMPVVLMYDVHASDVSPYGAQTDFHQVYPSFLNGSQPSIYQLPTPWVTHAWMQNEYDAFRLKMKGTGPLIPWLSPGCYGEAESEYVEIMLLDTLLNGANGFDYYGFSDFDTPMDFYYHAKALVELAPYQELLTSGRPCKLDARNPAILTTGFWNEKTEMLALVANYQGTQPEKATLALPFRVVTEVLDLADNKPLTVGAEVELVVPAHGFRLLHVRGTL